MAADDGDKIKGASKKPLTRLMRVFVMSLCVLYRLPNRYFFNCYAGRNDMIWW